MCAVEPPVACDERKSLPCATHNCCPNPVDVHTQKQVLAFRRLCQSMLKTPSSTTVQTPVAREVKEEDKILAAGDAGSLLSFPEECWNSPLVFRKYTGNAKGHKGRNGNMYGNVGLSLSARDLNVRDKNERNEIRFGMYENHKAIAASSNAENNVVQDGLIRTQMPDQERSENNRQQYPMEKDNLTWKNEVNRTYSILSFDEKFDHNDAVKEGILILGPIYESTKDEELQNERNNARISLRNEQNDRAWVKTVEGEISDTNSYYNEKQSPFIEREGSLSYCISRNRVIDGEYCQGTSLQEPLEHTRSKNTKDKEKEHKESSYDSSDQQLFRHLLECSENANCLTTQRVPEQQTIEHGTLQMGENDLESYIQQHLQLNEGTSKNRMRKMQQSLYAKTPESLHHSWYNLWNNINRKKNKTFGWKELGKIRSVQEMRLLGMLSEMRASESGISLGVNKTKLWNIGERGRKMAYDYQKRFTEKFPSDSNTSKQKETPANDSPFGAKQRYKCFFIGSDQYWAWNSSNPNSVCSESFKTSQDSNNNCSSCYLAKDSSGFIHKKFLQGTSLRSSRRVSDIHCSITNIDNSKHHPNQTPLKRRFANFIMKMRNFYSLYKYSGYKKLKIGNFLTGHLMEQTSDRNGSNLSEACTIRGYIHKNILGRKVPPAQDAEQSQGGNGGKRPLEKSKSNKENNFSADDEATSIHDKDGSKRTSANVFPPAKSTTNLQRSFDIDYRGRQRKPKVQKVFQRSISSDEDRGYGAIAHTIKYRDKDIMLRPKDGGLSQSSKDPADCIKGQTHKRLSRSHERKRTSQRNKKESTSEWLGRDISHSRRKYSKTKSDQSSSSQSSSSSCSSSRARTGVKPPHRVKRKSIPKETIQADTSLKTASSYDETYDQTKFLARLDSVLSDLVENEKKKISKYGQPRFKEIKHVDSAESVLAKTSHKKEGRQHRKKSSPEVNPNINPSVQQLRATLRAVRVKKRTPVSCDLLDKHAERFTERLPHNPRILKSQVSSQLLAKRCYQPPRQKKSQNDQNSATVDYASDFYSSDEDHEELKAVCQKDVQPFNSIPKKYKEKFEETDVTTDEKGENDTCSGSDKPVSKRYSVISQKKMQEALYRPHHGETGDSGDFSVDSAYTGSRGATPENVLTPNAKCRSLGGSLTTALPAMRFYSSYRHMQRSERLIELKRNILYDIKHSKLYSDESINLLLDEYKRKCCDVSATDVEEVILSVQEDLGVKPRPDHYICHLLQAADERRLGEFGDNITADTSNPQLLSLCTKAAEEPYTARVTSSPTHDDVDKGLRRKLIKENSRQKLMESPKIIRKSGGDENPSTPELKSYHKNYHSREEKEDKAWAEATLGEVAPNVVAEAVQAQGDAKPNIDDSDQDWSGYVTDLCQQFDIKL